MPLVLARAKARWKLLFYEAEQRLRGRLHRGIRWPDCTWLGPGCHPPDLTRVRARPSSGELAFRAKRDSSRGQATGVGSLSQESLPERRERGCSVGASLRGVVAAAECVEQVCAVGGHQ
jgi:hypothetical protein